MAAQESPKAEDPATQVGEDLHPLNAGGQAEVPVLPGEPCGEIRPYAS